MFIFKLLNTFHKIFKLSLIFSAVIASWTSIILLSSTTFNLEIKELITQMYLNQKNFILNVKDLSVILVKDANERFSENNQGTNKVENTRKKINNREKDCSLITF